MSEKVIVKVLKDSGLTEIESQVYIFLAKNGIQNTFNISRGLGKHKAQVYRILKHLQTIGVVESTLESPMRFIAVPFEKVVDLLIKSKEQEAGLLKEEKNDLLATWKEIHSDPSFYPLERFVVIEGRNIVYSRILQMIEDADHEILAITNSFGIVQANQAGIIDAIIKRKIRFRILTQVTKENMGLIKHISNIVGANSNILGRNVNLVSNICPRFIIKDEDEGIFFTTLREAPAMFNREETALWTNSKGFLVIYAKAFFEELWNSSTDLSKKLREIDEKSV